MQSMHLYFVFVSSSSLKCFHSVWVLQLFVPGTQSTCLLLQALVLSPKWVLIQFDAGGGQPQVAFGAAQLPFTIINILPHLLSSTLPTVH